MESCEGWTEIDRFHWGDFLGGNKERHGLKEVRSSTKEIQIASFQSLKNCLDTETVTVLRNNSTFQTHNPTRRKYKSK